ncbi:MAG TPA: uroporphyrinogen-III synthase [Campylobacterales bacterium]|nr:uroporphyrinogen-III synthase [Campylobacterales bacterium]
MGIETPIFILSEKQYEDAQNLPVILIKHLSKNIDLSPYEALIFSSKNGVIAIDALTDKWKDIPSYSIGTGTSKEIEKRGGKIVYEAKSSYGDDFAKEIREKLNGKKALFLRAKVVTSSLNTILEDAGVILDEEVVYETVCAECNSLETPPENSIIIFSSPSTIECFFKCFTWNESYMAVVIGTKTAAFLPKEIPFEMAPKQSIPSCIEFSKILRKKLL